MLMKKVPINQLFEAFESSLSEYEFSKLTMSSHRRNLKKLVSFMRQANIFDYEEHVGLMFLESLETKNHIKQCQRTINQLNKIVLGLPISKRSVQSLNFPANESGDLAREYLEYIHEKRLSFASEYAYARHAYLLIMAMEAQNLTFKDINREFVLEYVGLREKGTTECSRCVRSFLQFLFEKGIVDYDYAPVLKRFKTRLQTPPISYYEPEEIAKLENSINRSTPTGKRDYAMILLASRLGLRSSDILQLKFENLDWDRSLIVLTQYKTKRNLKLPILKEVGEAFIDYIINVRPKIESKNIFISMTRPFKPITTMTDLVKRYFVKAGISLKGRRHGAHALRHSLATSMLNNGASLPVISEALGHSSTDSTMCYLTVGIKGLLECSLEVAEIDDEFYNQREGIFYENL